MKKTDSGYHCSSCKKTVIDFRKKSIEEFASQSTGEVCGIFSSDQLTPNRYGWRYKMQFFFLTILSVIGFQVAPIRAQTSDAVKSRAESLRSRTVEARVEKQAHVAIRPNDKLSNKKKQWHFLRRRPVKGKVKFITIGCPSF